MWAKMQSKCDFREVVCPKYSNTYQYMHECVGGYFLMCLWIFDGQNIVIMDSSKSLVNKWGCSDSTGGKEVIPSFDFLLKLFE